MIRRHAMETILFEALKFIGASAAGGLTWDVMKGAGSKLLANFKKHFVNARYFKDKRQAEDFFKNISSKESLNKRHPLEDIWSVYDNCTGSEASGIIICSSLFCWIKSIVSYAQAITTNHDYNYYS